MSGLLTRAEYEAIATALEFPTNAFINGKLLDDVAPRIQMSLLLSAWIPLPCSSVDPPKKVEKISDALPEVVGSNLAIKASMIPLSEESKAFLRGKSDEAVLPVNSALPNESTPIARPSSVFPVTLPPPK